MELLSKKEVRNRLDAGPQHVSCASCHGEPPTPIWINTRPNGWQWPVGEKHFCSKPLCEMARRNAVEQKDLADQKQNVASTVAPPAPSPVARITLAKVPASAVKAPPAPTGIPSTVRTIRTTRRVVGIR